MSLRKSESALAVNDRVYTFLVRALLTNRTLSAESCLRLIEHISRFACEHHTGRFADGALDNRAMEIGLELERLCPTIPSLESELDRPAESRDASRRILHVATEVAAIGGHTRTIQHWVSNDPGSSHSLIVTNQSDQRIPVSLAEAVRSSGGAVTRLPSDWTLLSRARWVREFARRRADLVVVHHHGFDIVPTVAFAVADCPPVAILNHADHHFWSGSSVADLVVNLRSIGSLLTARRRRVQRNVVLPIPLTPPDAALTRDAARRRLGVGRDQVVLLSVGRAEKYRPSPSHDFFKTTAKILARHEDAHLYLIGVTPAEAVRFGGSDVHPRLHPMGPTTGVADYHAAADLYLEGFPFGSQTALLEAALAGVTAVPAFAPTLDLVVTNDDAISDLLATCGDEAAYLDLVSRLIDDPAERRNLGVQLQQRMRTHHTGAGWQQRLETVYDAAFALTHRPRFIPLSECIVSHTDVALSEWQNALRGADGSGLEEGRELHRTLLDIAFAARQSGAYRVAFRILLHCCRRWPGGDHGKALLYLAKLLPHWALRSRLSLQA